MSISRTSESSDLDVSVVVELDALNDRTSVSSANIASESPSSST